MRLGGLARWRPELPGQHEFLPVRVRQASRAPQLRDGAPPGDADADPGAPSPDEVRSTMTALQRGWERGRNVSGTAAPSPEITPDPDGEGM